MVQIRQIKKPRGIITRVAKALGISYPHANKIFNGKHQDVSPETIIKAYKMAIDEVEILVEDLNNFKEQLQEIVDLQEK